MKAKRLLWLAAACLAVAPLHLIHPTDAGKPGIPPQDVQTMAISPDGRTLAVVLTKGVIKLLDVGTGKEGISFPIGTSNTNRVIAMEFARDGRSLVVARQDAKVQLWEITSGRLRMSYVGHSKEVCDVVFSRDGKTLYSCGGDQTIRVWEVDTGKQLAVLEGNKGSVNVIVLAEEQGLLASGTFLSEIKLWDIKSHKALGTLENTGSIYTGALAFSPDGKKLISTRGGDTVTIWDVAKREAVGSYKSSVIGMQRIGFTADGKLVIGQSSNYATFWDADTTAELANLPVASIAKCLLTLDSKSLISMDGKGVIKTWDLKNLQAYKPAIPLRDKPTRPLPPEKAPRLDILGDALPPGAVARLGTLRMRDPSGSTPGAAVSPDGKFIASSGNDARVHVWDAATGKALRQFQGPERELRLLPPVFSPDGKLLAAVFQEKITPTVVIWEFESGKEVCRFKNPGNGLITLGFADGGKTFLGVEPLGVIRRWDAQTGQPKASWNILEKEHIPKKDKDISTLTAALSPDGKWVAIHWRMERSKEVLANLTRLYDLQEQEEMWRSDVGDARFAYASFSADGKFVAHAMPKNHVQVRETVSGKIIREIKVIEPDPRVMRQEEAIALSPDGKWLVAQDRQGAGVAGLWDLSTGKKRYDIPLRTHPLDKLSASKAVFFPDNKRLLVSAQGHMWVWDIDAGKPSFQLHGHSGQVRYLHYSADGKTVTTGVGGDKLSPMPWKPPHETINWNTATWKQIERKLVPAKWFTERPAAISFDHRLTVVSPNKTNLELRSFPDDKLIRALDPTAQIAWGVNGSMSPDGRLLVVRDNPKAGNIHLIDLTTGNSHGQLPSDAQRMRFAFGIDQPLVAWIADDHRIVVFDARLPQPVRYFKEPGMKDVVPWSPLAFSPSGRWLAEWDRRKGSVAVLWDLKTGKLAKQIPDDEPGISYLSAECIAFSPNEKLLAMAGVGRSKGEVEIWDVASGLLLRRLVGHQDTVCALAFSPDGRLLASGSDDTTALIWDVSDLYEK